jgi:hypothetical protein
MTDIDPMVSLTIGYKLAEKYRRQLDAALREMVKPELGYSIDVGGYEIVVRIVTFSLGVGGFSIRWSTLETLDDLPTYVRRLLLSTLTKMAESYYLKG